MGGEAPRQVAGVAFVRRQPSVLRVHVPCLLEAQVGRITAERKAGGVKCSCLFPVFFKPSGSSPPPSKRRQKEVPIENCRQPGIHETTYRGGCL